MALEKRGLTRAEHRKTEAQAQTKGFRKAIEGGNKLHGGAQSA
jgi:hypothetical protein